MGKITVIGSCVADLVAKVSRFPNEGETLIGESLNIYPGGKGANQCVAIKRLGGDVEMVGKVGNDGNGQMFLKVFNDEKIKCDYLKTTDLAATGCAQIQINDKAQNKIVVIPGANLCFNEEDLAEIDEIIEKSDILLFQLEMDLIVTEKAIKIAKAKGKTVILNPAPATNLKNELLESVDYLTPNEVELGVLANCDTSTKVGITLAIEKLIKVGVKNIIATLGGEGAIIGNSDGIKIIKGFEVKVVDTVAAGDSFNGALAVKLSEGATVEEAINFANAMGALTVTKHGAIPSLHNREEVESFILSQKSKE